MDITMHQCEFCNSITDNRHATKYWIHIDGVRSISQAKGRFNNVVHETWYQSFNGSADFCGWKCFKAFIRKEKESK